MIRANEATPTTASRSPDSGPSSESRPEAESSADEALFEPPSPPAESGTDAEIAALFERYRETGDRAVRNELIERHRWLAVLCAKRFAKRGEPVDDLVQVAQLGLLKGVQRFDPSYGATFVTFAMPTVMGELKRYFRDSTWRVRVPRRLQELHLEYKQAVDALTNDLRRPPLVEEIAAYLRVTVDDVLEAMDAGASYRGVPLVPPSEDGDESEAAEDAITLGDADPHFEHVDASMTVRRVLQELAPRERRIVELRFFEGLTQSEIAEQLGISQVHVSRLLRQSLLVLQRHLTAHSDE